MALAAIVATGIEPLEDRELVDDRSLEAFDADRFGHGDFVRELTGVVSKTETPVNIALFGPWGSGKSGIANLLEKELPKDKKALRFVTFDASKYAEAPLRRHFISQVAHRLGIKDSEYHDGLYEGIETRNVRFRPRELVKLVGPFIASALLAVGVLLLISVMAAALSKGPFADNWTGIVKSYLLAALPVGVLITTFVKLAGDGFHLKINRGAPSGNEEFEKRFNKLVAAAKTKRLVVFIDELDRCSPAQVASTLETMKTFLFVPGCVFIVAADQQVLEQALRRKVRQHTPEDSTNPYYSAGSSYLDKVFQYQLTLPPVRATTLSRFALKLVDGLPGVWTRIDAVDEVVSVLIPTHVTSPRRVKVLLNRFVIAYRLAERRRQEGNLDPNLEARASELAKLVCLQCEFPLFAEDLTFDARLPEFVSTVSEGGALPPGLRKEVRERAKRYARGALPVAELLVKSEPNIDMAEKEQSEEQPDPQSADEQDAEEDDNGGLGVQEEAPSRADAVLKKHAQQLVDYLRKTRHVRGPAPDLLYLESAGADHGVDLVLADDLQRAAIDNDVEEVLRLIDGAGDVTQRRGALSVLADVVRQAQPGAEGRNVVSALLQAVRRSGIELGDAAEPVADAVIAHLDVASLEQRDLLGALALARASGRDFAPRLVEGVIRHEASVDEGDIATALLGEAAQVSEEQRPRLAKAAKTALLENPEGAVHQLGRLDKADTRFILGGAGTLLKPLTNRHYEADRGRSQPDEDAEGLLDPPPHVALGAGLDVAVAAGSPLSAEVAALMLEQQQATLQDAVLERLAKLAPITDERLIAYVLSAADDREPDEWPRWLDPIDRHAIAAEPSLQKWLDGLKATLWSRAGYEPDPLSNDTFDDALTVLARCDGPSSSEAKLLGQVDESLAESVTTEATADAQRTALTRAARFVDAGLLSATAVADLDLAAVTKTLEVPAVSIVGTDRQQVSQAVLARVRAAAPDASEERLERALAAAPESWLNTEESASVTMNAAAARRRHRSETESPLGPGELRDLAEGAGAEEPVEDAIAVWLGAFAERSQDVWHVVEPLVEKPLPGGVHAALSRFSQQLDSVARFDLVQPALERAISRPLDLSFFEAAHLSEVPAQRLTPRLIELAESSDKIEAQKVVIALWARFGPSGQPSRKRLVRSVYLPLISSGAAGLDVALSSFHVVADVKGVQGEVKSALKEAATNKTLKRRVDRLLVEAGWSNKGPFGLWTT